MGTILIKYATLCPSILLSILSFFYPSIHLNSTHSSGYPSSIRSHSWFASLPCFSSFVPQQPDVLETFNRGAMVGLLVVAVAIAMVMVISLLLVRRKPYGTISHGIVEVSFFF